MHHRHIVNDPVEFLNYSSIFPADGQKSFSGKVQTGLFIPATWFICPVVSRLWQQKHGLSAAVANIKG